MIPSSVMFRCSCVKMFTPIFVLQEELVQAEPSPAPVPSPPPAPPAAVVAPPLPSQTRCGLLLSFSFFFIPSHHRDHHPRDSGFGFLCSCRGNLNRHNV